MANISVPNLSLNESESFMTELTDQEFTNIKGGIFGVLIVIAAVIMKSCE
jgi:hypothetical protein